MKVLLLAFVLLGASPAGAASPVLPPSANAPLRDALATDEGRLDGRLTLSNAMLNADSVTVSYQAADGGAAVLTVTLGHPSQKPDGLRAGPFVVLSQKGEDEAAMAALISRLGELKDNIWLAENADDVTNTPTSPNLRTPARTEADKRISKVLWHVDRALVVGETDSANTLLDSLAGNTELPSNAMLDIAERYQRNRALNRAKAMLNQWKASTINDITSPVAAGRAVTLGGGDVSALKVLQDARVSDNACGFEKLAESMDAMGHRTEAYLLLDTAARKTDCPGVEATMLEWFVADGRQYEAEQLSAVLVQHNANNLRVSAVRANLLLESGNIRFVLDLLEPLIRKYPTTSLVSTYLLAQQQQLQSQADREAIGARSDANIEDALLALTSAFAHQEAGDDKAAGRYLKRAEGTFDNHRIYLLLRGRLAFNRGDRTSVAGLLKQADALDVPDVSAHDVTYLEALRGELLRWTDPKAARDTLRHIVLRSAQNDRCLSRVARLAKAQVKALDECISGSAAVPCPGPFLYPADHPANTEFTDEIEDQNVFGHGLTIFGVLLLFLVMVRQSRLKKQRVSRWK